MGREEHEQQEALVVTAVPVVDNDNDDVRRSPLPPPRNVYAMHGRPQQYQHDISALTGPPSLAIPPPPDNNGSLSLFHPSLKEPPSDQQEHHEIQPPVAIMVSSRHIQPMNSNDNDDDRVSFSQTGGRQSQAKNTTPSTLTWETIQWLQHTEGFPPGLIHQLDILKQVYAVRYWIVDNSGSMLKSDCQRFVPPSSSSPNHHTNAGSSSSTAAAATGIIANCSRWDELQRTVLYHANLAAQLGAPTIFKWLHNPGPRIGPAEVLVEQHDDVLLLKKTLSAMQPGGRTPLTAHIHEVAQRIRDANYEQTGQKAVVVIATDGMPTGDDTDDHDDRAGGGNNNNADNAVQQEFVQALRQLGSLPVWIVIRLCTNDAKVIQYYRDLDDQLEFEMEVIDDFVNEAKQIDKHNHWLG
jgi:hypothetical protein